MALRAKSSRRIKGAKGRMSASGHFRPGQVQQQVPPYRLSGALSAQKLTLNELHDDGSGVDIKIFPAHDRVQRKGNRLALADAV